MQRSKIEDLSRIYKGFNEAYFDEPQNYEFNCVKTFGKQNNGMRLQLNDDVANGYWELFRATKDMLICMADGMYHAEYRQPILSRHDIVTIRFILSGGLSFDFERTGRVNIPQASVSILYTHKDEPFDLFIDDGSHLCSVTVHIKPEALIRNIDLKEAALPKFLSDILFDVKEYTDLYNFPLSPVIMNDILAMLNMTYEGQRRALFIEAKASEMLCRLFQEIEDTLIQVPPLSSADHALKNKVFEAQRLLVEQYKSPLTIDELARRVGINRSTLSAHFKDIFGTTVFEFSQDYRMNKAREMLQDRSLNISQVAEAVGYEHPTNFTSAFKKHYGFPPKDIRPGS